VSVGRPLPTPEPATAVAVLIGRDEELRRRLGECCERLGSRVVEPDGDEPADLVIADADLPAAARRVKPGGTLVVVGGAAGERLETAPLVLAEIDVVARPGGIRLCR
jgi:hypothetical protein